VVERIDVGINPESGKPHLEGVTMAYLPDERKLRVTTPKGESWVFESNLASVKPVFEDRAAAARKAKQ
jgi:hypothetical protein